MKKILSTTILLFCCALVMAQSTTPFFQQNQNIQLKRLIADSAFRVPIRTDTGPDFNNKDSIGMLILRRSGIDTSLWVRYKNWQRIATQQGTILNQATNQTGAIFNIDRGIITQGAAADKTTGNGTTPPAAFQVTGGTGGTTVGAFAPGDGSAVQITGGTGGAKADPSNTRAGRGGSISITGGTGGLDGTTRGMGGSINISGGQTGPASALGGIGGSVGITGGTTNTGGLFSPDSLAAFVNISGGTAINGVGGNVGISGGPGPVHPGNVYLATAWGGLGVGVQRGAVIIGATTGNLPWGYGIDLDDKILWIGGKTRMKNSLEITTGGASITGGITLPTGAGNGKVLTSDGSGVATWQAPSLIPGALEDFYITVGNTSATANTFSAIYQYTIPANTLSADGDKIAATYGGLYAANANNKTLEMVINGNSAVAGSVAANGTAWEARALFIRTSSTTGRIIFTVGGSATTGAQIDLTGMNYTSTITFDLWGAGGGAANDVVGKLGTITKINAAP